MKIVRRNEHVSIRLTSNLFVMPTMIYIIQKLAGVQHNEYEFIWWIVIPSSFIVWFMLNFKINK